jgi:hypothetical protein
MDFVISVGPIGVWRAFLGLPNFAALQRAIGTNRGSPVGALGHRSLHGILSVLSLEAYSIWAESTHAVNMAAELLRMVYHRSDVLRCSLRYRVRYRAARPSSQSKSV